MPKLKSKSYILKKRVKKNSRSLAAVISRYAFLCVICFLICAVIGVSGFFIYLNKNLPRISSLQDYHPPVITEVFSDDGRKIGEFYKERRIVIKLNQMPKMLIEAFIAAEDARFYKHKGIDLLSIIRAFFKNLEAGTIVQGGSTITQQVTKSFLLTPERSYIRKIKEAVLAYKIDKALTKDQILYLYLNQIYLGHGAYGVEAASENYFGKPAKELNLAECAMLAGLPQAPSRYSPFKHPDMAKQRQIYVLNRMVSEGYITNIQAMEAMNEVLDIKPKHNWFSEEVPFFTEYIRRMAEKEYGADVFYKEGLNIYTTVNIEMQQTARRAINKGLRALDKRQGYRGPVNHLEPEQIESYVKDLQNELDLSSLEPGKIVKGVVIEIDDKNNKATVRLGNTLGIIDIEDMRWARKPDPQISFYEARVKHPGEVLKTGDIVQVKIKSKNEETNFWNLSLEQTPDAQAALICMESETGRIKVMVGGRDYRKSQFNRAIQSRRQPGSAFKPIIYAAALDKGYTPASVIIDSPIVFKDEEHDFTWKPKNYGEKFYGPTLFRDALAKSRNVVTIKILRNIGIDYAISYARKLGITSNLNRDLSIALGSSGVSLLELVKAYSVFCNLGYLIEPSFITKIVDRNGNIIKETHPVRRKVLETSTAYIMTHLLEGVVKEGTGRRVRALKRPVAGKTGTTNNLFDAWFIGYTPRYVTGVWVGYDNERSLGKFETGSRAASPIWLFFMQDILADKPVRAFKVPDGVVFCRIDAKTGLLPIPESEKTVFECFKEGTEPKEYTKKPYSISEPEEFFKSDM